MMVNTAHSLPFLCTALSYLALGAWVLVGQANAKQRLYGILCLTTSLWQFLWASIFLHTGTTGAFLVLVRFCYTGFVFVPVVLFHFIVAFTDSETDWKWLPWVYVVSGALALLVWVPNGVLNGFHAYPWGAATRAGRLHPIFVALTLGVIVRTFFLLRRVRWGPSYAPRRSRQNMLVRCATLVYCGGVLDLISGYGVGFVPLSYLFTGTAVVLFGIAIFRYEFLAAATQEEAIEERSRREAASAEMRRLGMVAAFPLISQGELLGYLLLGEKMSEESYSKEDLLLLRIVANQAALAYQRVRYLEMAVHGARTEMLGEIAGGFAHEIKTPLANISLPAELSIMDLNDLEQGKRSLQEILPELKTRLKDIMLQSFKASEKIEAIRQFSKPGHVRLEPVDLSRILENSIGLLGHLLHKANVRVVMGFPPTMAPIRGDAKQLEIVFVNLIKNAAEAMGLKAASSSVRELSLNGQEEGNWIVATVKDSGPGIKRTDFGHLFEAYFTTKGSEGTGMGLFLSQQVIKAHGGSIEVRSEEGKGTEFIIRLPKYSENQSGIHQAA